MPPSAFGMLRFVLALLSSKCSSNIYNKVILVACHVLCCILIRCLIKLYFRPPLQTGKLLKESDPETGHQKSITAMSKSADGSHFITGSHDKTAKLWDTRTLKLLKTYTTERPVNAAAISPLLDHVWPDYS